MSDLREKIGITSADCIDDLMVQARGQNLDDPANSGLVQSLESTMFDGANLISTILECSVPGCNRELAVTTTAGYISLDATFSTGKCIQTS